MAAPTFDGAGNLFGTTYLGGSGGTVYELTPNADGSWTESIIHSFGSGNDGSLPEASVVFDSSGNMFGTTSSGGDQGGWGTVFEVIPGNGGWTESILQSFSVSNGNDAPTTAVTLDAAGNLYGTTSGFDSRTYQGAVFELVHSSHGTWKERIIHSFTGGADGGDPSIALVFDKTGNLYGQTFSGGRTGGGVTFGLKNQSGKWSESIVGPGGTGGFGANSPMAFDASGNLYGVVGDDVVRFAPSGNKWTRTTLYQFPKSGSEGTYPNGVTMDPSGNFYGTNYHGGMTGCANLEGCGTVFKLTLEGGVWKETTVYEFTGGADGGNPVGGVVLDSAGNLYGATELGGKAGGCGGYGCGVVFEIVP